jgi:NAD+ kinase
MTATEGAARCDTPGQRREVLVLAHTGRPEIRESAQRVLRQLVSAGISPRVLEGEVGDLDVSDVSIVPEGPGAAAGVELVLVLGGDGSLLRGAEVARGADAPLLGINLGRVGFLAEAESEALEDTVDRLVRCDYHIEERMTVDVVVRKDGQVLHTDWALNEASVEKSDRARMLDCVIEIEERPLSRWGCDGVLCATPTGSTAYAFSAGGPIVWPGVEALLLVPISAHALFARPMVVDPDTTIAVEVLSGGAAAILSCDGRRTIDLPDRARIEMRRGSRPVRLARTEEGGFTDRLVRKFELPVGGWRGRRR